LTDDASEAGYTASAKLFDEIFAANLDKSPNPELLKELTRVFKNGNSEMGLPIGHLDMRLEPK
jgi:hypothetical protein